MARQHSKDAAIRAIEAAYAPIACDRQWLNGITLALGGLGLGKFSAYSVHQGVPVWEAVVGDGLPSPELAAQMMVRVDGFAAMHVRAVTPAPRWIRGYDRWTEVTRFYGTSIAELERHFGMTLAKNMVLLGTSADGKDGVVALLDKVLTIAPTLRKTLQAIGAHLEHAYRLRQVCQWRDSSAAQAVLSPGGKLLHAEPDAQLQAGTLVAAVQRCETARGKMRRLDPEEAIQSWQALVEGQWSVVEHIESDGKRYILALENPAPSPELNLTQLQAKIVNYAVLGHSQKYIAYELGLSEVKLSRELKAAMTHLRVKTRAELVQVYGGQLPAASSLSPRASNRS